MAWIHSNKEGITMGKRNDSAKHRTNLIQTYDHLYEKKGSIIDDNCVYCDLPAEHLDHVPPISWVPLINIDEMYELGYDFWKVCSCGECNFTLNNQKLFTIAERKQYLLKKYKKKYRKITHQVRWDEDELEDMSDMMRKEIEWKMHQHSYYSNRILFLMQAPDHDIMPIDVEMKEEQYEDY